MQIKISKTHKDAIIPQYSKQGDAGLDLTAISYNYVDDPIAPYHNYEIGLAFEIPEGYVGLIFPRSSVSSKNLMLTNSVGVIDSGYRGSISARFKATNGKQSIYKVGERVAQLVIVPYLNVSLQEVDYSELSKTERGIGSFGSSGK